MQKPCAPEHQLKGIPKVLMPLVVWVRRAGRVHIGDRVHVVPHRSEDNVQAVGEQLRRNRLGAGIVSSVSGDAIGILFCDAAGCHQGGAGLFERWNRRLTGLDLVRHAVKGIQFTTVVAAMTVHGMMHSQVVAGRPRRKRRSYATRANWRYSSSDRAGSRVQSV
jgi:hypothetical protein